MFLCTVELHKQAGIFKITREVLEKQELQASAFRTSRVFLKIPKCLYTCNSTMHEEQVFYFFYKIETQKQMPLLVLKRSNNTNQTMSFYIFFNFLLNDKISVLFTQVYKPRIVFFSSNFILLEITLFIFFNINFRN